MQTLVLNKPDLRLVVSVTGTKADEQFPVTAAIRQKIEQSSIRSLIACASACTAKEGQTYLSETQIEAVLLMELNANSFEDVCKNTYFEAVDWLMRFERLTIN